MKKISTYLFLTSLYAGVFAVVPAHAGSWTSGAPLETPKAHLGAVAAANRVFAAGGSGIADSRADFESIGIGDDNWAPELSLPKGLQQFGIATDGQHIIVIGGFPEGQNEATAVVWSYDLETSSWSARRPMPKARAGHSAVGIGGIVYVFGGLGADAADFFTYDIEADLWSDGPVARMPSPRASMAAATDSTRIYLVGGQVTGGAASGRVDAFDPLTGEWAELAALPRARSGAAAAVLDGQLHVVGGASLKDMETFVRHDVLNLSGGGWRVAEPMLTARHSAASAVIDGSWYVIGGGVGVGVFSVFTASDAVEIYRP